MKGSKLKIKFVGDIHCNYKEFLALCHPDLMAIIQVGDFGFGPKWLQLEDSPLPENTWFIRGNHDDPSMCKQHPQYLGDYGVKTFGNVKIGFLGGAYSIDYKYREEGISIWHDEEQSLVELQVGIDLIAAEKPQIIVTHECPTRILCKMLNERQKPINTRTGQALDALLSLHAPKLWVYGHHHESWEHEYGNTLSGNTKFVCLEELESLEVDLETM